MSTSDLPMADPSIEFRNVSARFRIPAEGRIGSLKEWIIRQVTGRSVRHDAVEALDDISFAVDRGTAVGVIGSNGAGKSTLLRVAAGILQPSRGISVVRGRIAPVIELGIGFEQELTGRENIFFNGALLGRSQHEMHERMDEIVEFAELGSFIDQPIRTYSTGMVARLAFSVATTVDAKVLLLDEVLSVGDERFRLKCGERFSDFRRSGVTILFVSHALDSVESFCDEVLWLDRGRIHRRGDAADVVEEYRRCVGAG
jgi:ABC-2 type transport system ATP-binding protein/lipopolysaccharide transport system ATP-binding protein